MTRLLLLVKSERFLSFFLLEEKDLKNARQNLLVVFVGGGGVSLQQKGCAGL